MLPREARDHLALDLDEPEMATGLSMGFATRAQAEEAMRRLQEQGQRGGLLGQTSKPKR